MTDFAEAMGVLFFAWFAGWVFGYQLRQIIDALEAA